MSYLLLCIAVGFFFIVAVAGKSAYEVGGRLTGGRLLVWSFTGLAAIAIMPRPEQMQPPLVAVQPISLIKAAGASDQPSVTAIAGTKESQPLRHPESILPPTR